MLIKVILKAIVLHQICLVSITAYSYDILFQDEEIYTPCNTPNVNLFNEYMDMSNVTNEFLNNGSIYIHGEMMWLKDVGTRDNPFAVEVFKKSRGEWINTIYSVRRPDYCKAFINPSEIWYDVTKVYGVMKCPFYKGLKVDLNQVVKGQINISDAHFVGEYKFQLTVHFVEPNESFCVNIIFDSYISK